MPTREQIDDALDVIRRAAEARENGHPAPRRRPPSRRRGLGGFVANATAATLAGIAATCDQILWYVVLIYNNTKPL